MKLFNVKKLTGITLSALLTVTAIMGMTTTEAKAAESAGLSLTPSVEKVVEGNEFTVDVAITSNPGITGISLEFEGENAEIISVTKSGLLSGAMTGPGTYLWSVGAEDVTTTGTIATVKAKALNAGNASISVKYVESYNVKIEDISFNKPVASIKVICANHTWGEPTVNAATCTKVGSSTKECTVCGEKDITEIPATGHNMKEETTAATCTKDGVVTSTCQNCDETTTTTIKALGHAWDEGKVTKEATCTTDGEKTFTCKTCSETKTEVIKAGHTWDEGKVTKEATEKEEGEKQYTCKACGETKVEKIEKKIASTDKTSGTTNTTNKTNAAGTTNKTVKTGDTVNVMVFVCAMLAAVVAGGTVIVDKKRRNR